MNEAELLAKIDSLTAQLQKVELEVEALQRLIPVVPAAVQLLDQTGKPAGFGPADDPEGVFKGMTLKQSDTWSLRSVPVGISVQALAGGSLTISVADTVPAGVYGIGYALNGVGRTKQFTVT